MSSVPSKRTTRLDISTQQTKHVQAVMNILENGAKSIFNDSVNSDVTAPTSNVERRKLPTTAQRHTQHVMSILENGAKCVLNDSLNSDTTLPTTHVESTDLTKSSKQDTCALGDVSVQYFSSILSNAAPKTNSEATENEYGIKAIDSNLHNIRRTRSFTSLESVPEERQLAYVVHSPTEEKSQTKRGKLFDIRNLRLSFRRKQKQPQRHLLHNNDHVSNIQVAKHFPRSTKHEDHKYYYDLPLKDCASCRRLLKDTRFCKCPGAVIIEEGGVHSSTQFYHATETMRHAPSNAIGLPDSGYQGSITNTYNSSSENNPSRRNSCADSAIYGTATLRREKKYAAVKHAVDKPVIENLTDHRPYAGTDSYHKRTKAPPKESAIKLIRTLYLSFLTNKWICDLAVTSKDNFILTDLKDVHIINSFGNLKRTIGKKGTDKVYAPMSVALDNSENIFVSDHSTNRIQVYNGKGVHVSTISDNCLSNISSICCKENDVIATSIDHCHISVHSRCNKLTSCIKFNQSQPLFQHPISIAINPLTGDIIVGDDHKQCVVAMTASGRLLWIFTPPSDRQRPFFPSSLCSDTNGYIFVADLCNECVYMLDCSGKLLKTILSTDNGLDGGPALVRVDNKGHLILSDAPRTLKIFQYGENGFALYRRFSYCPDALYV